MKRFSLVVCLTAFVLFCGTPPVALAELFDGEREGLLLGVGVGYAAIASGGDIEGSATGFAVTGKLGYGLSDQLTIYLSSTAPSILPSLGFMYSADRRSDYYLLCALGYTSADEDSLLSISGGMGYELSDQLSLELIGGYIRYSDTYTSQWNPWTGRTVNETSLSNVFTIAATFNVHFY